MCSPTKSSFPPLPYIWPPFIHFALPSVQWALQLSLQEEFLLALPAICHPWSFSPPSVLLLFVSSSGATTQFQLLLAALTGVAESVVYICLLVFLKMTGSFFSISFPFCMLPRTRSGGKQSCQASCNQKSDNFIRDTLLRTLCFPFYCGWLWFCYSNFNEFTLYKKWFTFFSLSVHIKLV